MSINIEKMSTQEKLRLMERLWDDLCRNVSDLPIPGWHAQVLQAREKRLEEGKEEVLDWEQAKKDIRDSVR